MSAQIIIKASEINKYFELKKQGYKTLWAGEGKICLVR